MQLMRWCSWCADALMRWCTDAADALMLLNQDQDLPADLSKAICSSFLFRHCQKSRDGSQTYTGATNPTTRMHNSCSPITKIRCGGEMVYTRYFLCKLWPRAFWFSILSAKSLWLTLSVGHIAWLPKHGGWTWSQAELKSRSQGPEGPLDF